MQLRQRKNIGAPNFNDIFLNFDQITKLFPFFFVIDRKLIITSVGQGFKKYLAEIVNCKFDEVFCLEGEDIQQNSFQAILKHTNLSRAIFCKKAICPKLSGQFILIGLNEILFIGAPKAHADTDNEKLNLHISKLKQNEKDLIEAKENAINLRKTTEQFLANVSHELRNTINIISGLANLLKETRLSKKQNHYLSIIKPTTESLLALLNDVLEFEKTQDKQLKFKQEPFNFLKCINEVFEAMSFQATKKNLFLNLLLEKNLPEWLIGDDLRLKQILINIVANAIKFTEKGGVTIDITSKNFEKNFILFTFEVLDTGIGIPADQIENLFTRFTQINFQNKNHFGGTGLGLAIVKNLVELQNGSVEVKSRLNGGSCFKVVIPFQLFKQDKSNKTMNNNKEINIKSKHILVVDDNEINQMIIAKMLSKNGATYEVANNGSIAIEKMKTSNFDLVLLDLQMPVMDGYQTANYIRNNVGEFRKDVPILAVTANALASEKEKCFQLGMNEYLCKPFQQDELIATIYNLCNSNQQTYNLTYLLGIDPLDKNFVPKLLKEFLISTPLMISELHELFELKNWEKMTKLAHKLKSNTANIAAKKLTQTLSLIEIEATNKNKNGQIIQLINQLTTSSTKLCLAIEMDIKNLEK